MAGGRILIVRSEKGRIVESDVVEGRLTDVVKDTARRALEEWDPEMSDFVVLKDVKEVELELPIDPDLFDVLKEYGGLVRKGSVALARLPVYTISFDNRMITEESYVENKIYLVTLYINDDLKAQMEVEATSITSEKEAPEGIEEIE